MRATACDAAVNVLSGRHRDRDAIVAGYARALKRLRAVEGS